MSCSNWLTNQFIQIMQYKMTFLNEVQTINFMLRCKKNIYYIKSCILLKEIITSHSKKGIKIHFLVEVHRQQLKHIKRSLFSHLSWINISVLLNCIEWLLYCVFENFVSNCVGLNNTSLQLWLCMYDLVRSVINEKLVGTSLSKWVRLSYIMLFSFIKMFQSI